MFDEDKYFLVNKGSVKRYLNIGDSIIFNNLFCDRKRGKIGRMLSLGDFCVLPLLDKS